MFEIRIYGVLNQDVKSVNKHLDFIEKAEEAGNIWSFTRFVNDVSDNIIPSNMEFRAYFVNTEATEFQSTDLCYINEPVFLQELPSDLRVTRDNTTNHLLELLNLSIFDTTDEEIAEISKNIALPYFKYTISELIDRGEGIHHGDCVLINPKSYLQKVYDGTENTVEEKALKWYEVKQIRNIDEDLNHYVLSDGTALIDDDILFVIQNKLFNRIHKDIIN